ncbi:peptidoglycan DD-metalloendopeptidase family protein [Pontibacter sp. HSC-36F09]|uniref:peptidoglycan DD-metalloendopeptidase family protein n=1 Tax=Pontibacter sp. HSC-36F09 TaxID=2910966 RepID=UPI00209F1406|nr:peptidoglycan DD-metalloendopeptidase family protein [Pontibacter sp. HSC-36F09]MCP2045445.1 murein DD-endopeptidase MepM/ murein hydrolase activator NlpD/SH3-like domain-containing protein [Pontibacter sp. HSC-36F09]
MNRKPTSYSPYLYLILITLFLSSCGSRETLRGVFKNQTPFEAYVSSLKTAKLDQTAVGQDWLAAGEAALQTPTTVTLPFKETGYFPADEPRALGYKVEARRGEKLVVSLEMKARQTMQVFMDLFEASTAPFTIPKRVASADTAATTLTYVVDEDMAHLLRIQPELLRGGTYTITIQAQPTLAFPIPGKSSRHIASIWGDPRDAGARSHEGIDIFAPRGTPVVASANGLVSRVDETPRGGKVIWLSDRDRGQNLYYAHLDQQLVSAGQRVTAGDTLGLVGNTGNARGTGPHLHFGIYRYGHGATNPYPYVHQSGAPIPAVKVDAALIGNWVRVASKMANVRTQPSAKASLYTSLPKNTPLQVTGAANNWYRVRLPDQSEAYIISSLVEGIAKPIALKKLKQEHPLLDAAHPEAGQMDSLPAGVAIPVVAINGQFELVRQPDGRLGWLQSAE